MSSKSIYKKPTWIGKIHALWMYISHLGVYDDLSGREKSKIKFINQLILFTIFTDVLMVVTFFLAINNLVTEAIIGIISSILKIPVFIFHRSRYYLTCKVYIIVAISILVAGTSIYGGLNRGIEYAYPLLITFVSICFDKKIYIFLSYLWLLFVYLFSRLYISIFGTFVDVSADPILAANAEQKHDFTFVICMIILGIITKWYIQEFNNYNQSTEKLNKQLIAKNKKLEQFTYITSHDLQEPLKTINMYSQLLKSKYENQFDEMGNKALTYIDSSANRMQNLVKALLDHSQIGMTSTIQSINCEHLINEIILDNKATIKANNAKVKSWGLPKIDGYEMELRLLFQNLISNAIKYRNVDLAPQIQLSAHEDAQYWRFIVQDNGIGIAEKNKEKIFEVFQRLHNKDDIEGTGIGLSHCKKIVEAHQGDIWVESTVNQGSAFYFTISKHLI